MKKVLATAVLAFVLLTTVVIPAYAYRCETRCRVNLLGQTICETYCN